MPARRVLLSLALLAAGCGAGVQERLESSASAGRPPDDLVVIYDDYHPRWGGTSIEVRGDRTLSAQRWRPGAPEREALQWSGTIPEPAMKQLLQMLVDIEAWDQQVEEDSSRLDDARATLSVQVGGERTSIWEWGNDLEANRRIVRIKQHLEALAFEIRHPMAP